MFSPTAEKIFIHIIHKKVFKIYLLVVFYINYTLLSTTKVIVAKKMKKYTLEFMH